ncbi:cAMP-binding domain of CRP or a regulatory subunit of cAMP-dependent protein kinases [Chitinophaga rupis]|uniref:cAMP-binding domain of CRP or a regulatory subunit of cAMP-dependent protein kinases n=1 Tax=Chitinophaga rupis TaxID=573321 RepID=A0A1H7PUQ1_9BACT|nr:response regulator [Chitinophaga rupis]SEL39306.1 cAMP-binding domain of CRP or a regulatory subunit of cAMP-dependent protein kinases [Chitinophaga rupis]
MKKILIIEDNPEIRENTQEILELAGYKVFSAENGKDGVEQAIQHIPDLILCDITMPVLDGFGVLHMLQRNDQLKDIPFIFLTAKTERSDFRKGMEMGADDYITKPFSGTDLLTAIESRLKKAQIKKQVFPPTIQGLRQLMQEATGNSSLRELSEGRNIEKYKKKQAIYVEGNHPLKLFYVQKGKVRTFKRNDDGKELALDLYSEGDFMGYIAMLEQSVYKDTAEAMDECEIAIIPREDFEELLNNNPEVAVQFIRMLAKNITVKEQQLLGLAYNSLRKKVAEALMNLHTKYNQSKEAAFTIDVSRDNLATIAGTATESLIRTLGDFREEKLIDIKGGTIQILNEKKLSGMIN